MVQLCYFSKDRIHGSFLNLITYIIFEILIQNGTYYFDVTIDGVRKLHIKNIIAREFSNVEIYAGEDKQPYQDTAGKDKYYQVADAEIRNFHVCQLSKTTNKGKVRL